MPTAQESDSSGGWCSVRKNEATWLEKYRRWQINVQLDGVRRSFTSSMPGSKGKIKAEKAADKWLEGAVIGENSRVGQLLDEYYEHVKATTTKANYRQIDNYVRNHIKPVIGSKQIGRLTENDLQLVIDRAYKSGLAWKTLCNIRACLSAFMKYCRKSNVTKLHPEDITIPNRAKRPEKTIVGVEDIKTLFQSDKTMRYGKEIQDIQIHAYRFSVLTGIRPEERTGLKWTDIKGDKLTVRRAINDDQEATRGKNQNASRTISIGPRAKRELAEQRKMLMQRGLISKYVFPDNDGSFIIQKRFRLRWYPILRAQRDSEGHPL